MSTLDDLFHPVIELPEPVRQARYDRLVGLDDVKHRLRKEAMLLATPDRLARWAAEHHAGADTAALSLFADRAPLFVFAGDVGSGKSALAESFGCDLAVQLGLPVHLYRLRLSTRGSGLVGEMTSLIGDAFTRLREEGNLAMTRHGADTVLVFVVDEADALVQSREAQQMHHEAGPASTPSSPESTASPVPGCRSSWSCTPTGSPRSTRPSCAARPRRSPSPRPDAQQRHAILRAGLQGLGIREDTLAKLVELTGPHSTQPLA